MCSPVLTTSCGSTSCLIDSSREGMTPSVLYPMSSKTSSRSTLTTVPSTMSPSLKYLMVSSIAARKASSDPMSLTATLGVGLASVLLVIVGVGSGGQMVGGWDAHARLSPPHGPTGLSDLPGRPDQPRLASTATRGCAWPWRTAPEHSAAFRI